jgi:hypothetical protein
MDDDELWAVYEALHASVHMIATDTESTLLVMRLQEEALDIAESSLAVESFVVHFTLDDMPGRERYDDLITALEVAVENERYYSGRFRALSITDNAGNLVMTRDEIWENASAVENE